MEFTINRVSAQIMANPMQIGGAKLRVSANNCNKDI